ncbi:MAG: TIGR00341 family protein [Thermoplasmata archaeon]|nr:TIGR00341 family protein [Thermoplasmata archaeon]
MALRLIELILSELNEKQVKEAVKDYKVLDLWYARLSDEKFMTRILVEAETSEELIDDLERKFSDQQGFRITVLPVQASIPRPLEEKKEVEEPKTEKKRVPLRISREEMYSNIKDSTKLTKIYMVTVALSVIVAAIGITQDSIAVVIGAMVIAPLLGPNIALSLATTLADVSLARLSLRSLGIGIVITLVLSIALGYLLDVDPDRMSIYSQSGLSIDAVILALASGSAGALFITIGVSTALVGVMLAVALLPPLVTVGLLIGAGYSSMAVDASFLFLTNLICINLAGVLTFIWQGIRPNYWWEAEKAKKYSIAAIIIWILVLATLALIAYLSQQI